LSLGGINSIAVTPNGNQLIAGYEDKKIRIFDMKSSYSLIHTFEDIHQSFFHLKLIVNVNRRNHFDRSDI